jgi:LPXTG-motif cell wall-anchored protein
MGKFMRILWRPKHIGVAVSTAALAVAMMGFAALPAQAAPAAPIAPVAPAFIAPAAGDIISGPPMISGTGEPGSLVEVTEQSGQQVCTAAVDGAGQFACTGAASLPPGPNVLSLTATNSDSSTTVGGTVAVTVEPPPPPFMNPRDGDLITPTQAFEGGGFTGDTLRILDSANQPICSVIVDSSGLFSCVPTAPLPLGRITVTAELTKAYGAVEVTGPYSFTVVAGPPTITSPGSGAIVGDLPVFTGTGMPGAILEIIHGRSGATVCSTTIAADGSYTCTPQHRFLVGTMDYFPAMSANGTGLSGVRGDLVNITVAVTPVISKPADGGYTVGRAVIEGSAGIFSTVSILDGGTTSVCTTKSDADGKFSCTASPALTPGLHHLTPVQTNIDGSVVTGASVAVTVAVTGAATSTAPAPTASLPAAVHAVSDPGVDVQAADTEELAATGASGVVPAGAVGGLLLLGGAGSLLLARRRRSSGH